MIGLRPLTPDHETESGGLPRRFCVAISGGIVDDARWIRMTKDCDTEYPTSGQTAAKPA